jgi:hypothetical protein
MTARTTKESATGRNTHFELSREDFVALIKAGKKPGFHIRVINGVETPCANPNSTREDNLG